MCALTLSTPAREVEQFRLEADRDEISTKRQDGPGFRFGILRCHRLANATCTLYLVVYCTSTLLLSLLHPLRFLHITSDSRDGKDQRMTTKLVNTLPLNIISYLSLCSTPSAIEVATNPLRQIPCGRSEYAYCAFAGLHILSYKRCSASQTVSCFIVSLMQPIHPTSIQ